MTLPYATPAAADSSPLTSRLDVVLALAWFPVLYVVCATGRTGAPMVLLLVLLVALPLAAVVLGYAARRGVGPAGGFRRRRRRGTGAMALGATQLGLMLGAALLLPSMGRAREPAQRVKCASNLRQIGQALQIYANDYGGRFPPGLDVLLETGDLTSEVFVCPSSNAERAPGATTRQVVQAFQSNPAHCSYVYVGADVSPGAAGPGHVLAYEPMSNHAGHREGDGMNVLYGDGSVTWVPKAEAQRLIAELKAGHNPPRQPATKP